MATAPAPPAGFDFGMSAIANDVLGDIDEALANPFAPGASSSYFFSSMAASMAHPVAVAVPAAPLVVPAAATIVDYFYQDSDDREQAELSELRQKLKRKVDESAWDEVAAVEKEIADVEQRGDRSRLRAAYAAAEEKAKTDAAAAQAAADQAQAAAAERDRLRAELESA